MIKQHSSFSRAEYLEILRHFLILSIAFKTNDSLREIESKMYLASVLDDFKFNTAIEFAKNRDRSIIGWFPAVYSSIATEGNSEFFRNWMKSEFKKYKMDFFGYVLIRNMAGTIPDNLITIVEEYERH